MSVTGIEKLEFGVEDLTHCAKFMRDFGLTGDASGQRFTTLSGARVELNPIDSPDLPPAFEAGNTLRRMTWAVADRSDLDALRPKLAQQPGFREVGDALECLDPNGMTLRVQVSQQTDVELNVEPINQWGDARRIDTPARFTSAPSRSTWVTWCSSWRSWRRWRNFTARCSASRSRTATSTAPCSCAAARGGHHNLFLLQLPHRKRGLNHVAFTVRDIHEVIGGGIAMNKNEWSTFIGPGRHPVSSAYFWYVNSPTGGAFEYYTNDDYLTENWQPRELEHSLVSFTEWAVEGGIDHDTRRQQKKPEAV